MRQAVWLKRGQMFGWKSENLFWADKPIEINTVAMLDVHFGQSVQRVLNGQIIRKVADWWPLPETAASSKKSSLSKD